MKVTLLSTYLKSGGAAIACQRLLNALNSRKDISAEMVVYTKESSENVTPIVKNKVDEGKKWLNFILERFAYLFHEKSAKYRYSFSPAAAGINPLKIKAVQSADVINIHWFNQGFLSLQSLHKLTTLKKPIIFTLHDMWMFTGGCHYSGACQNYKTICGFCPYLKTSSEKDLSTRVWERKKEILTHPGFTFVTCSSWLKKEAKDSSLLRDAKIEVIPNPIDTSIFTPQEKLLAKEKLKLNQSKKHILFGAMNIEDERKGFVFLIKALKVLACQERDIELIVFGKANQETLDELPLPVNYLGSISSKKALIEAYSAGDVFVLPSLEDNLPNTVMEAMACGTPVVAFQTGGLGDLVDHEKNGYLAKLGSAEDLAFGIESILNKSIERQLSKKAVEKVLTSFSQEIVAKKYINLFEESLKRV